MCVFCYNPGLAIGEITLVGGPFVGAAVHRVRRALRGGADPEVDGAAAQPEPARSHTSAEAAQAEAAAAATNATG